jgi:type III secretion protein Q
MAQSPTVPDTARQAGLNQSLDIQLALAFGPRQPCTLSFPVGAETVTLTLAHAARLPAIPLLTLCVSGTINDAPFQVYVDWAIIDACLEDLASGLAAAILSPETKALLVEAALASHLDDAERALDAKITIKSIEMLKKRTTDWNQPSLKFMITWGNQSPCVAYAAIPTTFERRLIGAWSGRVDGRPDADPELAVTVRVGCVTVTPAEFAGLAVDDVLVLDETPLYNKQCCLIIGERLAALGTIAANQLLLSEPLTIADTSWNAKLCLSDAARPEQHTGQPGSSRIKLAVDLARQKISVSQLLGLDLARSIALPRSIETGVEVYAGRTAVGFGNIVRVGDSIAVRLVRLNARGQG